MVFLGIDGGGSKTAFLLEDEVGRVLERIETGPSNWLSAGEDTARQNIAIGIQQLKSLPDIVCGGFAGAGRPAGIRFYNDCLTTLLPNSQILVQTDAFIAYIGAIGLEPGVLLIAGTGSIAIGRRADGSMIRAGGWGPLFSDDGSGFWIGREAIRIALQYHDTGTHAEFVASICQDLRLPSITEVSSAWKSGELSVQSVAALTTLLFTNYPSEAATRQIVESAGFQLGEIAKTAIGLVGLPHCRLSIAGSIGRHPEIRKRIGMEFDDPAYAPERGAIIWARSQAQH